MTELDTRPRGKQAVQPVEFSSSYSALFGKASLISAARTDKGRGVKAEESVWAVQRGMKPDEGKSPSCYHFPAPNAILQQISAAADLVARREQILRAAGQYISETPTGPPSIELPAGTSAPARAKTIARWTMAMNPAISLEAQQQANKVFDAFLK